MAKASINENGLKPTTVVDEVNKLLLGRYEDLLFVDDVTEVSCKRCRRVLIHHYEANCGHLFCRNCKRVLSQGNGWRCPECREYITHIGEQRAEVEERVYGLMVHCLNHKYGCKLTMPLRQIIKHLEVCEDTKEANLPMFYTGKHSKEAMMKRIGEMAQEIRQLKEAINQSQNQTQDHLLRTMKEAENEHRTDNAIKFSNFESRINGLRSDLTMETIRLQSQSDDNKIEIMKEVDDKLTRMEETENYKKYQCKDIDVLRDLILQSVTAIDNKMKQVDDIQRRDAERMEQRMERWNNNLLIETTKLQSQTADNCKQNMLVIGQSQKQVEDRLIQIIKTTDEERRLYDDTKRSELESRINAMLSDLDLKLITQQSHIDGNHNNLKKEFNAKWSKLEETAKNHTDEIQRLRTRIVQSQIATENKIKHVEDNQHQLVEQMEALKQKTERWKNSILADTVRLQTQTEGRCNQRIRELEENLVHLKQQQDEMGSKLNEVADQGRRMATESKRLKADITRVQDNVSEDMKDFQLSIKTALSELDNKWTRILEGLHEKLSRVKVIDENQEQLKHKLGGFYRSKESITSEFGEGSSSTLNRNDLHNFGISQSMPEALNKKSKTDSLMASDQRLNETRNWEEASSYTYKEFIRHHPKYKVPEYNVLLLSENAAEITKFINSFEVLTKYTRLDDAISKHQPVKPLVSTPFQIHDINGEECSITLDEADDTEDMAELRNRRCKCYEYLFSAHLVRFIDSAGYGTTAIDDGLSAKKPVGHEEPDQDGQILQDIRNFILKLQSLHSIVLVTKSTEVKLSPGFLNSLKGFLANFNKFRASNLLFVMTEFENTSTSMEKAKWAVEQILRNVAPMSGVKVNHSKNTFFIYNKGLRSVMAHSQGLRPSDSEMTTARKMWQMASEQCLSLVASIRHSQPWKQDFFNSIFRKKHGHKSASKESK